MQFVTPYKGRDKASTNIAENFEIGIKKERNNLWCGNSFTKSTNLSFMPLKKKKNGNIIR